MPPFVPVRRPGATRRMDAPQHTPPVPTTRPQAPPVRLLAWAAALGLLLAVAAEAYRVALGANFQAVVHGRVYRCAQQSPAGLERLVAAHHIRTVVNLRGC